MGNSEGKRPLGKVLD